MSVAILSEEELRELVAGSVRMALERHQPSTSPPAYDRELLSEREAQRLLGVSRSTLVRGRKSGRIPFRRLGRRVIYVRADLMNALGP